jgi:hypothetical protein
MWLRYITTYDKTITFIDILFFADNFDSAAATGSCWFHNVHVLKVANLPFQDEAFVVFREHVSCRCDVERFAVKTPHPLDVTPH